MTEKRRRSTGKATLADVARLAGVSAMTASRALRMPDKVSPEIRQKVERAVDELDYVPNLQAQNLASGRSRLIMMVTPSFSTPGFNVVSEALQQGIAAHGYTMMFTESKRATINNRQMVDKLMAYNPAAVVLYHFDEPAGAYARPGSADLPVIKLGAMTPLESGISIGVDYSQAVQMLVNHLAVRGFNRLGLLCTQTTDLSFNQILRGWNQAMLAVNQSPHRVVTTPLPDNMATGHSLLADIRLTWPELDALICTSDEVACGCLMACHSAGIGIPDPLALASLGGSPFTAVCAPPLTCIEIPWIEMGTQAAKVLLARLNGHKSPLLTPLMPRLAARASTAHQ